MSYIEDANREYLDMIDQIICDDEIVQDDEINQMINEEEFSDE